MAQTPLNHEEADRLIAEIDLEQYERFAQLDATACVKVLPYDDHDADHPPGDFLGLKNHGNDLHLAFLRWREKPVSVPVKLKVPAGATVYVAKKGNYPFLYRDKKA